MRLEGTGIESEVATMQDDGAAPDQTKGDGIYSSVVTIKEPLPGTLSFTVQANYIDVPRPVRSRPAFLTIAHGVSSKEKNAMLKIQQQAQ